MDFGERSLYGKGKGDRFMKREGAIAPTHIVETTLQSASAKHRTMFVGVGQLHLENSLTLSTLHFPTPPTNPLHSSRDRIFEKSGAIAILDRNKQGCVRWNQGSPFRPQTMDTTNDSSTSDIALAESSAASNSNPISLEQRLATLEAVVATLQHQLATLNPPTANWLQQISGTFKDDPGFDDVLAYGQAIRQADRPDEQPSELSA